MGVEGWWLREELRNFRLGGGKLEAGYEKWQNETGIVTLCTCMITLMIWIYIIHNRNEKMYLIYVQWVKMQSLKIKIITKKRWFTTIHWGSSQSCKVSSTWKSINIINNNKHFSRPKEENHMVISIDRENTFDKTQHPSIFQTVEKLGIVGTYFNIMKAIYAKSKDGIILNREKKWNLPCEI